MTRCSWASNERLKDYHDNEYGRILFHDQQLFELLTLEIFQPGLSFDIVLQKRDHLRLFFNNYNIVQIASFHEQHIASGLEDSNIIRHRKKIEAIIANARLIVDNNINLLDYILSNIDYREGIDNIGILLCKQMKRDGFKFIGPSVATSLVQALGLMHAHQNQCVLSDYQKSTYLINTKFGVFEIIYKDFIIISSHLYHNQTVKENDPKNSFEYYLKHQVNLYERGLQYNFKLLLDTSAATQFQKLVWSQICKIKPGQTLSYSDLSYELNSNAFRAVGMAASKCKFALFIPAHRLVSKTGLGGFQNQLALKKQLLQHEGVQI